MSDRPELITRRRYLIMQACMAGANVWLALEAVASTAIEHPEWDMDELATWEEWDREMQPWHDITGGEHRLG